jgi:hypothetical protein
MCAPTTISKIDSAVWCVNKKEGERTKERERGDMNYDMKEIIAR